MKMNTIKTQTLGNLVLISLILFISGIHCNLTAQSPQLTKSSIEWEQIFSDSSGNPSYIGGFTDAAPSFVDIDNDGDYDCFIGNHDGFLFFFENTGTPESAIWTYHPDMYKDIYFDYLDEANVSFADIDADGDYDMFLSGQSPSTKGIHYFKNTGTPSEPLFELISDKYQDIETDDSHCKTTFADMDNDNDLDLLFEFDHLFENDHNHHYYENTGDSANPVFIFKNKDYFNFGIGGWSGGKSCFIDIDKDNDYDCVIGISSNLIFMKNIGTPDSAVWILVAENYDGSSYGHKSPSFCDIDNDDDPDMFIGVQHGQLLFYENVTTDDIPVWEFVTDNPLHTIETGSYSSPELCDINGDDLPDLFIVSDNGILQIWYYNNTGTLNEPEWQLESSDFLNMNNDTLCPNAIEFADIDNDNDYDLFVGLYGIEQNYILFYENTGDAYNPQFDPVGDTVLTFDSPDNIKFCPALVDIDSDNDLDMFISVQDGTTNSSALLHFFENEGTISEPVWVHKYTEQYVYGKVAFMDEDNDGDYDMFFGGFGGDLNQNIVYFKNTGDKYNPYFEFVESVYADIDVGRFFSICFYDIDYDNDNDLIIGEFYGGINLFRNNGYLNSTWEPITAFDHKIYPNPANNEIIFLFNNDFEEPAELNIYNLQGKFILNKQIHSNECVVEIRELKQGLYIYEIISGNKVYIKNKFIIN